MRKETTKEAAERMSTRVMEILFKDEKKWQQERRYSEDEVLKAQQAILCNIKDALMNENYIIEYIEQFKKK